MPRIPQPTMPMLILSFGETALARDEVNVAAARPTPASGGKHPAEASRVSGEHWDPTPGSGWQPGVACEDGYFWLGSSTQPRVNVPASASIYPCPAV